MRILPDAFAVLPPFCFPLSSIHYSLRLVSRRFLLLAGMEPVASFLWLTAFQYVKGEQDLADLPPGPCCVPREAVDRGAGQISETQEATREVGGALDRGHAGTGHGFHFVRATLQSVIAIGAV